MSNARSIAKKFAVLISSMDFAGAFGLLAEDGKYTVIGKTPVSGTYHGPKDLFDRLVPVLGTFKTPPALEFQEPIVDGDRVVLLAAGSGEGPAGPYDQPHYAFVMRVRGEKFSEITEFMDTATLVSALYGRQGAAASGCLGFPWCRAPSIGSA